MKLAMGTVLLCLIATVGLASDEQVLITQSANGTRTTRPFMTTAGWEVRWDSPQGSISIWILDKEGNPIEHAATQEKAGKGSSYYAKPGIYSLKINSRGDWTISVVQLP